MSDKLTRIQRSWNMAQIKGKDTLLEVMTRKYLWHKGYHYRKNYSILPGKPDIVLTKYNIVIFVNGCFWHHHNCGLGYIPKSRTDYWLKKFEKNMENDQKHFTDLRQKGYYVINLWECELKENFDSRMIELIREIDYVIHRDEEETFFDQEV